MWIRFFFSYINIIIVSSRMEKLVSFILNSFILIRLYTLSMYVCMCGYLYMFSINRSQIEWPRLEGFQIKKYTLCLIFTHKYRCEHKAQSNELSLSRWDLEYAHCIFFTGVFCMGVSKVWNWIAPTGEAPAWSIWEVFIAMIPCSTLILTRFKC